MEHLHSVHRIGIPIGESFYPFRDIVDGNKDVLATF
jgi:hypothetical protein